MPPSLSVVEDYKNILKMVSARYMEVLALQDFHGAKRQAQHRPALLMFLPGLVPGGDAVVDPRSHSIRSRLPDVSAICSRDWSPPPQDIANLCYCCC